MTLLLLLLLLGSLGLGHLLLLLSDGSVAGEGGEEEAEGEGVEEEEASTGHEDLKQQQRKPEVRTTTHWFRWRRLYQIRSR